MDDVSQFLQYLFPVEVSHFGVIVLTLASFLGSFITASLGVGGGAFLIIVMAEFISPIVLIPLHGLVQLASNGSRAWLTRIHIDRSLVASFMSGAIVASAVGLSGLKSVPQEVISWAIALFILYNCWGKFPEAGFSRTFKGRFMGGFITTFATMFAGATGTLVASWLRARDMDRFYYTANFSSCMTLQQSLIHI